MSVAAPPLPIPLLHQDLNTARKRTSSFSYPCPTLSPNPRPTKAARTADMGNLRRTESMIIVPDLHNNTLTTASLNVYTTNTPLPLPRTLQHYRDQRLRRKNVVDRSTAEPLTIRTRPEAPSPQPLIRQQPQSAVRSTAAPKPLRASIAATTKRAAHTPKAPSQVILPSVASPVATVKTHRTSSPLSPTPTALPGRPVFPRSKPEPDLYRLAIKAHMRSSPQGQKILHMGPRLALNIMTATQDLERIVADQKDLDTDVVMSDSTSRASRVSSPAMPVLTTSWVVVRGEDWEMVDCAA